VTLQRLADLEACKTSAFNGSTGNRRLAGSMFHPHSPVADLYGGWSSGCPMRLSDAVVRCACPMRLSDALVRLASKTIDELWNNDLVFISPTGQVSTKAQRLAGMKAPVQPSHAVVTASHNDGVQVRHFRFGKPKAAAIATSAQGT
jgi:hypothetical protein